VQQRDTGGGNAKKRTSSAKSGALVRVHTGNSQGGRGWVGRGWREGRAR
jgi:hypothetical protein